MAFKLDDIIIDKIEYGVALTTDSTRIHYVLTQLSDATIETTSESKESRDKNGTLIRKIYTGKSGTFSATNAMLNASLIASASGKSKEQASTGNVMTVPYAETVKRGTAATTITGVDPDTVIVVGLDSAGNMIEQYTKDTVASETKFVVATSGAVTVPTVADNSGVEKFLILANRTSESAIRISNESDKFPKTVRLILYAVGFEACTPDVLRRFIVVIPSFQPSPDLSLSLTTDATLEYKGDLQTAYCGADGKTLYEIFIDPEDIVEE